MKYFIIEGLSYEIFYFAVRLLRRFIINRLQHEEYGFKESDFPIHKLPKGDAPPKHVKINPNRKEHYQAVVKIKDAPLTFQIVRGNELYQSENCKYVTNRWVGATTWPQYGKKLDVIKVDDTTYVPDFYTDTRLDEDYYGEGVCKWRFVSGGFVMQPTGKDKRETALIVDITPEMLEKLTPTNPELVVKYEYQKSNFPIATDLNFEVSDHHPVIAEFKLIK